MYGVKYTLWISNLTILMAKALFLPRDFGGTLKILLHCLIGYADMDKVLKSTKNYFLLKMEWKT